MTKPSSSPTFLEKTAYLPYPSSAVVVVYANHQGEYEDFPLDKSIDQFIWSLREEMPDLNHCRKWKDGDGTAVLENAFAYIGVSEHFGNIAVWACPKDPSDSRAKAWIVSIESKLKERVGGSFGGTFTFEQMLKSHPMPEYDDQDRENRCLGRKLTVGMLRKMIEYYDENMEVRIAIDPDDPKQFSIGELTSPFSRLMWGHPARWKYENILFLAAGDPTGRLPDSAALQLGWATLSDSLEKILGEGN